MRIRIPYWPKRRVIIEITLERMASLTEYHMSEYEKACFKLAQEADDDGDRIPPTNERS